MEEELQMRRFEIGDRVKHRWEKWTGKVLKVVGDPLTKNGGYAICIDGRPNSYFVAQPTSIESTT